MGYFELPGVRKMGRISGDILTIYMTVDQNN